MCIYKHHYKKYRFLQGIVEVWSNVSNRSHQESFMQNQSLSTGLWKTWTVSLNNLFVLISKFKMKASSWNISKLRLALQNMYSAKHLQMIASGIAVILTISNGCLETSLKIDYQVIKISEAATGCNFRR